MKHVLFVCVENSNRSQMAEGFARYFSEGDVEAHSAGSRPSGHINPQAIVAMSELGIDISHQSSKGLDDLPAVEWDFVVTMGCGDACPHLPAKGRADWDLADPRNMDHGDFNKVRDDIARRVQELLKTL